MEPSNRQPNGQAPTLRSAYPNGTIKLTYWVLTQNVRVTSHLSLSRSDHSNPDIQRRGIRNHQRPTASQPNPHFGPGFASSGCPQFDGPGNFQPSAGLLAATPTSFGNAFDMTGDFTVYMWVNPVSRLDRFLPKHSGKKGHWPFSLNTAVEATFN